MKPLNVSYEGPFKRRLRVYQPVEDDDVLDVDDTDNVEFRDILITKIAQMVIRTIVLVLSHYILLLYTRAFIFDFVMLY